MSDLRDEMSEARKEREKDARWYVVHTYSGHENKVKDNIENMVANRGYVDDIFEVRVPMEEYVEKKDGRAVLKERKVFPSYVLIKMIVTDVSWYLVRNTRGVTGFVGPGTKPVPLTDQEARAWGITKVSYEDLDIKPGDQFKVISGPFESSVGTVKEINVDQRKIKGQVLMFGRDTSVELDFDDIEKL